MTHRVGLFLPLGLVAAIAIACGPKAPPEPAVPAATEQAQPAPVAKAPLPKRVDKAVALLTTGVPEDATKALSRLKELAKEAPDSPEIYYNQGIAYEMIGDEAGARKAYLRATDIDPSFGFAWLNMGAMSERDGELDRALQSYRAGLRSDGDNGELVTAVIGVLRKLGRYEEAERQARSAIRTDANNVGAYNNLGLVYLAQGKLELAQFVYQRAVMAVPGADANPHIHANLGRVFLALDKPADARVELEKALQLDPAHVTAMVALSQFHLDNRDWQSTADLLEKAREIDPDNPDIRVNLGIAYRGLDRHDEAERSYEKALDLEPDNLAPYLNLALLYGDHMQRFDKALDTLKRYRDLGGDRDEIADLWEADIVKKKQEVERQKEIARKREERKRKQAERQRLLEEEKKAQEPKEAPEQPAQEPPAGQGSEAPPTPAPDAGASGGGEAAGAGAGGGAAAGVGTTCSAESACDGGLACAQDGVCREAGTAGTFGPGVGCVADSDCGYGLSCSNNACAAGQADGAGQENVGDGTPSPWGGQ